MPLGAALGLVVVLDLRSRLIPDVVTLPGIAYALLLAITLRTPPPTQAVLGLALGGAGMWLLAAVSRGGVGGGDIKLVALLGAALGWQGALVAVALSQLTGAVLVLLVSLARRRLVRGPFPIGALIALFGALLLLSA